MTENMEGTQQDNRPFLWLIDSEQACLDACADAFAPWAECLRFAWNEQSPDWDNPPDAVFFSAEIPGGANGDFFAALVGNAGAIPLIAVARLRSLAQAVAFFRGGAADYLSLPLEEEDARERFAAAIERAARLSVQNMMMEVTPLEEEDILAQVPPPEPPQPQAAQEPQKPQEQEQEPEPEPEPPRVHSWSGSNFFVNDMPLLLDVRTKEEREERREEAPEEFEEEIPDNLLFADTGTGAEEEPTPVDGLPIPTLWEELPCGLLLFDSIGNLVFSNRLGLELLGRETLADLQDALESGLAAFAARGANHKPLPDNQWPHLLAVKTRAPRSAVLSVETGDKRRAWLRIDCQPHLADGKIARLSMTVVNLTGELPPLQTQEAETVPLPPVPHKGRRDKAKQRGRKKPR